MQLLFIDSFDWGEASLKSPETFSKLDPGKCIGGQPAIISNQIQFDSFTQFLSQFNGAKEFWLGIKITSTGWQLFMVNSLLTIEHHFLIQVFGVIVANGILILLTWNQSRAIAELITVTAILVHREINNSVPTTVRIQWKRRSL